MVMAEPLQSQPRRSPIQVGFYDIIRTIGKGNFASVKLARHRITKSEVAVKIIEKTRLDQSNWKKIYREIQILKLLRHQHIIKLYEVIETKSTIYLVCEYASHGEVFDYITQEEKIPEEKARKMFYQVLSAIEHCHKNNVVHRDLKAENLLLDANDNVKLADFGFGNFFQSGQNLNTWCGSPPYAAPEVFEGKLYEGPQLDIWSLGIVLYVLVCGTFPFDGSNLATLKDRVLAGRFRIPYWMSGDCENLIRRMLVVNPKKRLTIAQIKKHKWMQVFAKPDVLRRCDSPVRQAGHNQLPEFNEHILKLIQSLGIKRQETIESLRNSAYDHRYAIYHLLVDRLKHHRTSVPLETRFSYDAGKRRPSSIAEQSIAKYSLLSSPMPVPQETSRLMHKNQFFSPQQILPTMVIDESVTSTTRDDVAALDVNHLNDVQFSDEVANDLPKIHRSLAFSALRTPLVSQPPVSPSHVSKPQFINQPSRGTLPHQPWSFNAGTGISGTHYNRLPNSPLKGSPYKGSGDVPSVISIDEGVELPSASPSEQEMILRQANQQRRHTSLGIPDISLIPLVSLASKKGELLSQSPLPYGASQADSLLGTISNTAGYEQDSFSGSLEISCDVNATQGQPCDVTPRLVVSPCMDENVNLPPQQDTRTVYMEDQRQLLDVSPTGFREGRRASDGLLLLGDNRIGEDLKRLTRTSGISTINQDETDDNCFDLAERDTEHHQNLFHKLTVEDRSSEHGIMTSHSFQHAPHAPRSDAIYFQPYTPTSRRRSLQVSQLPNGHGGSYSKGMENPAFVQQAASNRLKVLNMTQESSDENDHYQWSSWKTVTDNDSSTSGYPNSQQRRDTIPLLIRTQPTAFAVASDESMTKSSSLEQAKRQPSLPNTIHSGVHQLVGQQSLVQLLQQRRLSRRLKAAQNTLQQISAYSLPLPELEQLKINVEGNFGSAAYNGLGFSTTNSNEELPGRTLAQGLMQQRHNTSAVIHGDSPELQHSFPAEPNEFFQPNVTFDQRSPNAFAQNSSLPLWGDNSESGQFQSNNNAMEYLSS